MTAASHVTGLGAKRRACTRRVRNSAAGPPGSARPTRRRAAAMRRRVSHGVAAACGARRPAGFPLPHRGPPGPGPPGSGGRQGSEAQGTVWPRVVMLYHRSAMSGSGQAVDSDGPVMAVLVLPLSSSSFMVLSASQVSQVCWFRVGIGDDAEVRPGQCDGSAAATLVFQAS